MGIAEELHTVASHSEFTEGFGVGGQGAVFRGKEWVSSHSPSSRFTGMKIGGILGQERNLGSRSSVNQAFIGNQSFSS